MRKKTEKKNGDKDLKRLQDELEVYIDIGPLSLLALEQIEALIKIVRATNIRQVGIDPHEVIFIAEQITKKAQHDIKDLVSSI